MSDAPWDLYAKAMFRSYRFPLWHADPELDSQYGPWEIELGSASVGYIDKGKFHHIFNAMKDAHQEKLPRTISTSRDNSSYIITINWLIVIMWKWAWRLRSRLLLDE